MSPNYTNKLVFLTLPFSFYIRPLISVMRAPPLWTNHFPMPPTPNSITLGFRFSNMNEGGHKHAEHSSCHYTHLHLVKTDSLRGKSYPCKWPTEDPVRSLTSKLPLSPQIQAAPLQFPIVYTWEMWEKHNLFIVACLISSSATKLPCYLEHN